MLGQFLELSTALETETTPMVQLWMNWMGLIFIASVLFVWKHTGARLALFVILLSMPSALIIYNMTGTVHLLGIGHLILWGPLLYWLVTRDIRGPDFKIASPYGIWVLLISATIATSLLFDVRDIYLVLTDQK